VISFVSRKDVKSRESRKSHFLKLTCLVARIDGGGRGRLGEAAAASSSLEIYEIYLY